MRFIIVFFVVSISIASTFMGIGHEEDADGVKITRIVGGSPAEIAGLMADDIITKIDGIQFSEEYGLSQALEDKNPGDLIKLKIKRCNKELIIKMILGNRDDFQGSMKKLR